MGSRAKARAAERTRLKQLTRDTREMHAEAMADPGYEAMVAAHNTPAAAMAAADGLEGQQARLRVAGWRQRAEGADGLGMWDHPRRRLRMIHSVSEEADGRIWAHLSLSNRADTLPGWYELRDLQWLIYADRPGIVLVAPASEHVNVANVMHIWTCLSEPLLPDFRKHGQV